VQMGQFLYSSPKDGITPFPLSKITLGTRFPGVSAGNDPGYRCSHCYINTVKFTLAPNSCVG